MAAARRYGSVLTDSRRWSGLEFRPDDIVISTPAKCGTTWMQMLCALLIFQDPVLPAPLTELSPWVDVQTEKVEDVFAALDAQRHRRFIKSHTPFDGLPHDDRVTYICVGRDPRDVAVSWDHHFSNMNLEVIIGARMAAVGFEDLAEMMQRPPPVPAEDPAQRFWEWMEEDAPVEENLTGLKAMLHHLQTFWDVRDQPNVALFHYRDMQTDLDGEMRRLAAVLGIAVDEGGWPALVQAATFDEMRGRADRLAPQVKIPGFWHDPGGFFHGSGGEWQQLMGPDGPARYRARVEAWASPDLAEWVHSGWRGGTQPPP